MAQIQDFDNFTQSYLECALWLSDEELDEEFIVEDIDDATIQKIMADCAKFQSENADDINGHDNQAGHDFWLTRNGHGAGFWDSDRPYGIEAGKRLTEAANAFGGVDFYVGDDLKLHI